MVTINPLDVFLWTVRRNEHDVVNLYDALSPIMQLATGGNMLNFGLWNENTADPLTAQKNMCSYIGELSELKSADTVVDVGSGLSAPAEFWKNENAHLKIFCINTNYNQLQFNQNSNIYKLNSTATSLPFPDDSVDRVIALESAQHFKPLESFFAEAKRILKNSGILTLAIPITMQDSGNLGILKFTWSSEHYSEGYVTKLISSSGLKIISKNLVGPNVYDTLADYYIANREQIKKNILKKYPSFVEPILYKSIHKMKQISQKNIINYLVLKCTPY